MKSGLKFIIPLMVFILLPSCYPGGAEYIEDYDVSISYYEPDYDWENITGKNFCMPDEIEHIKDGETLEDYESTYDSQILSQVTEEMQNLGLNLVDNTYEDSIDIVVAISLIQQNNIGAIWYPGDYWWGGWYPGWGSGWGWGYYPWYPTYYNFKTGSVLIHMGDYDGKTIENDSTIVPPIYEGALNGLLQGSTNSISSRITNGIEELFSQDPF